MALQINQQLRQRLGGFHSTGWRIFSSLMSLNGSESGGGHFPARFFVSSGPANRRINVAGKRKARTMNPLTQSKNTILLLVLTALNARLLCAFAASASGLSRGL